MNDQLDWCGVITDIILLLSFELYLWIIFVIENSKIILI